MTQERIASAGAEFVAALLAAADPGVPENEALDALREYGRLLRRVEHAGVVLIAALERRSVLARPAPPRFGRVPDHIDDHAFGGAGDLDRDPCRRAPLAVRDRSASSGTTRKVARWHH